MKKKNLPAKKSDAVSEKVIVASLEKKANPTINKLQKITSIKTIAEYDTAATQMKVVKTIGAEAAKEEKLMLSGIKQTEKRIRSFFKPFKDKVNMLESTIKSMMTEFLIAQDAERNKINKQFENKEIKKISTYTNKVEATQVKSKSASVRELDELEIVDCSKIPREYMTPDESRILEVLISGKTVPGCKLIKRKSIAI